MSKHKAIVLLNGSPPPPGILPELARDAPVYAADGGVAHCLREGVRPEWIRGDLDSLPREPLPSGWTVVKDADQNSTDFEKVLRQLPPTTRELIVLGGTGNRLDHTHNNLLAAAALSPEWRVTFVGPDHTLHRATPAFPLVLDLAPGTLLSLLPLGTARGVTTTGLRWNLCKSSLGPGSGLSQSNLTEGKVSLQLGEGSLFAHVLNS